MKYPKVYLAIDNCFAYKRWTRPIDWMEVISSLGVWYVEASADTELDPLYMGREYLKTWMDDVRQAEQKTGVRVANLYSGHGTYTTLGLSHTDKRVRERFVNEWFFPMVDAAAELGAGLGFFAHGFPDFVLQDSALYGEYVSDLYDNLARINVHAKDVGCKYLSLEQMYAPLMVPWTIGGTLELMETVAEKSGKDFYFTEDTGHHHVKFIKPTAQSIREAFHARTEEGLWLGTQKAFEIYYGALKCGELTDADVKDILQDMDAHPYLFTEKQDSDCYRWMELLGCYAPIVHLQQTDGLRSAHLAFTEENNAKGIVTGERVLRALKASYDNQPDSTLAACGEVYLTLEMFYGASTIGNDILREYKQSVDHWRQFVPQDGLTLDELVENLK